MKTAHFLLLTIGWVALMHGIAYAARSGPVDQPAPPENAAKTLSDHPTDTSHGSPADSAKNYKHGKHSAEQREPDHVLETNLARSHANLTKVNRPRQVPNNRERSTSGNAKNLYQPAFDKSAGTAKGGFIQNETVKNTVPVRPPSVVRPTAATLSNVHHRSPNPATINGSANSKNAHTGAINGTRMDQKH